MPNLQTVRASDLGCALNCVLSTGLTAQSASPTDDTARLNAFLATASASHPLKLILDGCAAITGLILSPAGYTTIEGLGRDSGSGLFLLPGSNQDLLRLGPYTRSTPFTEGQTVTTPAHTAFNITLADFAFNGNGHNNSTGPRAYVAAPNVPVPGAPAHPVFGAILTNCANLNVRNVHAVNPSNYCLTFANAANIEVSGCRFDSTTNLQDGIHIDGPSEKIRISNCAFATGDDAVALNAPEGYAGDISDVLLSNVQLLNSWSVLRVYSSLKSGKTCRVRGVVVNGFEGATQRAAFNIGIEASQSGSAPDQIRDILIANGTISTLGEGLLWIRTNVGLLDVSNVTFKAPTQTSPIVQFGCNSMGSLSLDLTIVRNPDGNAAPPVMALNIAAAADPGIDELRIEQLRVVDEVGSSYPPLPFVLTGNAPIRKLHIGALDMTHIAAFFDPGNTPPIVTVTGPGVLSCGVQFPDRIVANNTPYISASGPNAGKAVIKLAGRVTPL